MKPFQRLRAWLLSGTAQQNWTKRYLFSYEPARQASTIGLDDGEHENSSRDDESSSDGTSEYSSISTSDDEEEGNSCRERSHPEL